VHINFLVLQPEQVRDLPFTPFDWLKTGFDKLKANGTEVHFVQACPFVLSLSKHAPSPVRTVPEF
jgi:hypothetical protein